MWYLVDTIDDLSKVMSPKHYKHLKKGAHQSHLGRQKMGWFLADQPVHQVNLECFLSQKLEK